jgi:hypothetical protein
MKLRPDADQCSKAAFDKSAFAQCRSVLTSTESNFLLLIKAKVFLLIAEDIKFCYSLHLSRRHG